MIDALIKTATEIGVVLGVVLVIIACIALYTWFGGSKYICQWMGHGFSPTDQWYQAGYKMDGRRTPRGAITHSYCPRCRKEVRVVISSSKLVGYYDETGCKKYNFEWVDQKEWKLKQLLMPRTLPYMGIDPAKGQGDISSGYKNP